MIYNLDKDFEDLPRTEVDDDLLDDFDLDDEEPEELYDDEDIVFDDEEEED